MLYLLTMKLLTLTCVLITICSCASQVTLCDNEELLPHDGSEIECTGRRMELNHYMKEVTCVPRLTHVKLVPERGYTFYPNYAMVNRCGGFCPNSKSCLPVKTNLTSIIVRRDSYNSSQCYEVLVEEHMKCKCACSVMAHHCSIHHIYSEDNCACECMNRLECDESRQMVWDEKTCKCVCNKATEICASGLEWVRSRCR
ncbi:hypothetical protein X777_11377 [Ooceraea biroi]|uniref:Platelet-derived growth factor (PDGF) family profile domain-containing protein n=3 Tax=Ooceraea biroi TaxID=2015173 RepID=A0A026W4B9_OOCBI|nr:hypothetical protein X777_11377 [Ooceraea biroi]